MTINDEAGIYRADSGAPITRAKMAADRIAELAGKVTPGSRLGTKDELRVQCGVSVGTLNEALRLLQARGLVTVRPGPGGGLFAAQQSPMVRLGNSVLALDTDQASVAEAVRIRNALDPLLVEDALWHASPADVAGMRRRLTEMAEATAAEDATAFIRSNWALHARIAEISPNRMLRGIYVGLLDLVESHTMAVLPVSEQPLADYLDQRLRLHTRLVDAIADHEAETAMHLIHEHAAT